MNPKVGDRIVCIKNYGLGSARLTIGKEYTVLSVIKDGTRKVYVDIEDDQHFTEPVCIDRFKLIRHYNTKLGKILYSDTPPKQRR